MYINMFYKIQKIRQRQVQRHSGKPSPEYAQKNTAAATTRLLNLIKTRACSFSWLDPGQIYIYLLNRVRYNTGDTRKTEKKTIYLVFVGKSVFRVTARQVARTPCFPWSRRGVPHVTAFGPLQPAVANTRKTTRPPRSIHETQDVLLYLCIVLMLDFNLY